MIYAYAATCISSSLLLFVNVVLHAYSRFNCQYVSIVLVNKYHERPWSSLLNLTLGLLCPCVKLAEAVNVP